MLYEDDNGRIDGKDKEGSGRGLFQSRLCRRLAGSTEEDTKSHQDGS